MNATTLMIQGTTSDAGKSTVVAGLCRVLKRRGVRVAPFKPQNMALNSAVTEDGGEIGRAQAVQAQAAGLAAHTDMNPVLLKPNSDTGAQVIIHGRAIGNMEAAAYHDYKRVAHEAVLASHRRLSMQYQMIVVEGAGSPAEINLRAGDIANMGFAEAVDCPVILVADIDRGGVFAHLVGTLALLSESEQARVRGFIINRFRGDIALLQGGLDWLEERTGKPVLGVLPYLHGLHLEAEDAIPATHSDQQPSPPTPLGETTSHSTRLPKTAAKSLVIPPAGEGSIDNRSLLGHPLDETTSHSTRLQTTAAKSLVIPQAGEGWGEGLSDNKLRVIVPVLPHISNHTDFDPLRLHPQVTLHWVAPGETPRAADWVILPGSKNVRADLDWLRAQGWEDYLARHLRYGGKLMGICGGLQMLGSAVHDPHGIEGAPGSSKGLSYLDFATTLQPHKQLRNVQGRLAQGGMPVNGYEIHAGVSEGSALLRAFAQLDDGRTDGAISNDGQIIATYLHGVFESPQACAALLEWAGLQASQHFDYHALRERNIERLADTLETHLDMPRILQLFGAEAGQFVGWAMPTMSGVARPAFGSGSSSLGAGA